ncbi:hypothetical protein SAFG77S_04791 [Streptomyces afghaniensis]
MYSNTNYLLLGELLEHVTGTTAERYITRNVIERAGLRDTELPAEPYVEGPHSRIYEASFSMIDPPRDYSVFDMSWVGPAGALISTVADLNRFFRMLLAGEIVSPSSLEQMQRTVPVVSQEGKTIDYGLGLHPMEAPGQGTFWGHGGTVLGCWNAGHDPSRRQAADVRRGEPAAVEQARLLGQASAPSHRRRTRGSPPRGDVRLTAKTGRGANTSVRSPRTGPFNRPCAGRTTPSPPSAADRPRTVPAGPCGPSTGSG